MKTYLSRIMTVVLVGLSVAGCKPAESPPDLIKTQRETLYKAKAVEQQMQQQAQDQRKMIEDIQK